MEAGPTFCIDEELVIIDVMLVVELIMYAVQFGMFPSCSTTLA